jgi:predicted amidohydrolase
MKYISLFILIVMAFSNQNMHAQNPPKKFKLALVQMTVVDGDRDANLQHAKEKIEEAVANKADVILLPEAMDLGWTDPSALTEAQPIPEGQTSQFLIGLAKKHNVFICSGLIEKDGDKVYNSAIIVDPSGKIVLTHRKINELDIGHPYYALGDKLNACETPFGTIGLLICADANTENQVLTRSLAYMGADVILSPSSWAMPPDHDNEKDPYGSTWENAYMPVAKDFAVWIASSSNVGKMTGGPWKDWNGIGCSMVVDHNGKLITKGPYGADADTIIYVEIKPISRPAQGTEWPGYRESIK